MKIIAVLAYAALLTACCSDIVILGGGDPDANIDATPYLGGGGCTADSHWECPPGEEPFGVCLCHPVAPWERDGGHHPPVVDAGVDGPGADDAGPPTDAVVAGIRDGA